MLNRRQRKQKRNRNKSIQQKRQLLMESCEVRAAAASLSLPFGDMGSALQVDDHHQDVGFNESQHEVSQTVQQKQLGRGRARGFGAPRANPYQGQSFSPLDRILQASHQQDTRLQKSVRGLKPVATAKMSPTAWQTRIDVGMMQDVMTAGEGKQAAFRQAIPSTQPHGFQAPSVQVDGLEDPLTFRHQVDASAGETISNLLQGQEARREVAVDLEGRASEATRSRVSTPKLDLDSPAMVGDLALAPGMSEEIVSVCGSGDAIDIAESTMSGRTEWSTEQDFGMTNHKSMPDMQTVEKQATSLNQSVIKARTTGASASRSSGKMASFGGAVSHAVHGRGYGSGLSRGDSSPMMVKEGVVLDLMFDTDSVIQAEHLELVQDYMDELEIDSLEQAGTITACDISEQLEAGIHVLQPSLSGTSMMMLPAPASTLPYVMTDFDGTLDVDGISSAADVVRFDEDVLIDTAVIIADTVILDDAVVTLAENITEFIIVANTVVGYGDSLIQWELSGTSADQGHAEVDPGQAADGWSGSPHATSSRSSFNSDDGGDGDDGETGSVGIDGRDAPDVYLYLKEFTLEENTTSNVGSYQVAFPDFDLSGQDGGQGGQGQDGGDGGDGDKGADSDPGWLNCNAGPGWGGDGGDGGDGGYGGTGGRGGDAGDLNLYVVEFVQNTNVFSFDYDNSGGRGGDGGEGGARGDGGTGGDPGDPIGVWCWAAPEREGDDGRNGTSGSTGSDGASGSRGDQDFAWIDEEEWEEAFTRAYLVSPSSSEVYVGETIVFDTLNVTGAATLTTVDQVTGVTDSYSLSELGNDQYGWTTFTTMDAARLEVYITRAHDGSESNTYGLQLLPIVDEVLFGALDNSSCNASCEITEDMYEAIPGGQAYLLGYGFRDDSELVYDGVSLGSVTVLGHLDGREIIAFDIPLESTDEDYFIREDGVDQHTIYLNQAGDLDDSDSASLTLLKSTGLAFDPSVNAYSFTNGEMAAAADGYVSDRYNFDSDSGVFAGSDEIVVSGHGFETGDRVTYKSNDSLDAEVSGLVFGDDYYVIVIDDDTIQLAENESDAEDGIAIDISNGFGEHSLKLKAGGTLSQAWDMFETTYGTTEVGWKLVTNPVGTMFNFLVWYGWWAQDGSATCLGLSTAALSDYFNGVSDQVDTGVADALESVTEIQGHLLSPEILGSLVSQGYDNSATGDTVDAIVDFFDSGTASDGGDAPVIVMAPDGAVYSAALESAALVAMDIVSLLDGVVTLADVEAIFTISSDVEYLVDSWSDLAEAVGSSHALAPYRAVYDDPDDSLPSRLYFYDSNAPGDAIFMEIGEDVDGEVTFDYTNMDHGTGSYLYGTDEGAGWTMAHLTTDEIKADVDFLFGLSGWLL